MQKKRAKLFNNGGSQAVRLPVEFRFQGDEVNVRRDERTGDIILSSVIGSSSWKEFFALRDKAKGSIPAGFLSDRPLNSQFAGRSLFEDEP